MNNVLDFHLLNDYQRNFPLCPTPFAELARCLGVGERTVLARLKRLCAEGKISRVGAVFAPRRFGASTLAAMAVPAGRLAEVAELVNRFAEVNHNYEREHRLNLWFVVTAGSEARLQATLAAIEGAAGLPLLALPLLEEFHIDLGFPLGHAHKNRTEAPLLKQACAHSVSPESSVGEADRRLVSVLQEGVPLLMRPFARIAERIGESESTVLARIGRWLETGAIKRFGVVVRHRELGYTANAMWVQDIADSRVGEVGRALAGEAAVTLCYRRPRRLPTWPYNLFCMIHGQDRATVEACIAELRERHALADCGQDILFSRTRYKQQGARYV